MAKSCSCNDFTRSQFLRRGAAVAGKGLPSNRAGDAAAGRHGDRPAHVPAALRRCGAVGLWHLDAQPASVRRGHRPGHGRRRHRTSRCSCRSSWKAAGTHCRCSRRWGKRSTENSAPRSVSPKGPAKLFSEDESLMWHPAATGLAELHEEGKVTTFPAIGYQPPDESHFTSRHYWEVGQLDAKLASGWMGRYLDLVGRPAQPAAGPIARLLAGAGARHGEDARRGGLLTRRLHDVGQRPGRTGQRAGARNLRRPGRAVRARRPPTPRRAPPPTTRASCSKRWPAS